MQAAGATNVLPLTPVALRLRFAVPHRPDIKGELPQARFVSRDYLRAMGAPLVAGRWFGEEDRSGAQPAMMINRALAQQHSGADNPIGMFVNSIGSAPWQIIGVVDDIRQATLDREPCLSSSSTFVNCPGIPRWIWPLVCSAADSTLSGRTTTPRRWSPICGASSRGRHLTPL
ncbi:MAG: ABC transporter permease [Hymenobacter sp.]